MSDSSKWIFEKFYPAGDRAVRVRLKNGKTYEGRFIGYFLGDAENDKPYIFRWHFLDRQINVFDYDKSIDPEQGIYIEHKDIETVEFV